MKFCFSLPALFDPPCHIFSPLWPRCLSSDYPLLIFHTLSHPFLSLYSSLSFLSRMSFTFQTAQVRVVGRVQAGLQRLAVLGSSRSLQGLPSIVNEIFERGDRPASVLDCSAATDQYEDLGTGLDSLDRRIMPLQVEANQKQVCACVRVRTCACACVWVSVDMHLCTCVCVCRRGCKRTSMLTCAPEFSGA